MLLKRILTLWIKRPNNWRYQWKLELGAWLIKRGTPYKVGQPFTFKSANGKSHTKTIANLFYNFKLNSITHRFK